MNSQHGVRGAYSSSLRDSFSWKIIGPVLEASSGFVEKERESQISDFTFRHENSPQSLEVLFLTPSSLEEHKEQDTMLRLGQFDASDQSLYPRKAIAFLLSEETFTSASGKCSLNGLLALQVFLFENLTSSLPVIPIPDAASFLSSVHEYMANLEDIPVASPSLGDSVALLAHATSEYPSTLCERNTNILSDLFPSLKRLSEATRTREGQELLIDYLGEDTAQRIVKFWQEDILR